MKLLNFSTANGTPRAGLLVGNHVFEASRPAVSSLASLHPGDIVLTGTPAGVGARRNEFLQPGDHVEIEIERLGRLEHWID